MTQYFWEYSVSYYCKCCKHLWPKLFNKCVCITCKDYKENQTIWKKALPVELKIINSGCLLFRNNNFRQATLVAPTSLSPILLWKFPVLWRATGPQTRILIWLSFHSGIKRVILYLLCRSPSYCHSLSLLISASPASGCLCLLVKRGECPWVFLPHITPLSFLVIPISMTGSKPRSHYAETPPPSPPPQPLHMFHSTYLVSLCSQFGSGRANSSLIKQGGKWFRKI